LYELIEKELERKDEGEESIYKVKIILDKVKDLTQEVFLSLLHALYKTSYIFKRNCLRSQLTYEKLLEVINKLELSDYEKKETEEQLRGIKSKIQLNQ
jgi:hypothetical protein